VKIEWGSLSPQMLKSQGRPRWSTDYALDDGWQGLLQAEQGVGEWSVQFAWP